MQDRRLHQPGSAGRISALSLGLLLSLSACGGGGGDTAAPSPAPNPPPLAQTPSEGCLVNSSVNSDGTLRQRTQSYPCARYDIVTSRMTSTGTPVTMDFLVASPANGVAPKAAVVLIGGANFDMGIVGNASTGQATGAGGNFLVRTAQMFANAGYLAIALDRPSDWPAGPGPDEITNLDQYRISVRHAVDIASVLHRVNTGNLDVFLTGTSRGSMSVMAASPLGAGVAISSPVTVGRSDFPSQLYVGDPRHAVLQPSRVTRPAIVLRNTSDECMITPPANAQALQQALRSVGVDAVLAEANGGVKVTTASPGIVPDPCQALSYHAYLGIESTAVGQLTGWFDGRVRALGTNHRPTGALLQTTTPAGVAKVIDLAANTRDTDGDALTYALPYEASSLGGSVSRTGSLVTYTPPVGATQKTDHFVYVATDGRGGVNATVVAVDIL